MKIEDRIEALEKELDTIKALYGGLHGNVGPIGENRSITGSSSGLRCYTCKHSSNNVAPCPECFPDKPTQTLAQKIYDRFCTHPPVDRTLTKFSELAEEVVTPLLQSEYQRGKEETIKAVQEGSVCLDFAATRDIKERGISIGRKQAIEDMKDRFDKAVEKHSGASSSHEGWVKISATRRELFTPDK